MLRGESGGSRSELGGGRSEGASVWRGVQGVIESSSLEVVVNVKNAGLLGHLHYKVCPHNSFSGAIIKTHYYVHCKN